MPMPELAAGGEDLGLDPAGEERILGPNLTLTTECSPYKVGHARAAEPERRHGHGPLALRERVFTASSAGR
jgi:hypothetical protein